jgi:hypothetical protein
MPELFEEMRYNLQLPPRMPIGLSTSIEPARDSAT